MADHWPGPTSTVELNLEGRKRKSIVGVGSCHSPHLYGMSVTPAGLQGVEEPHSEVAHQQESHQLPPRLGLANGLVTGETVEG